MGKKPTNQNKPQTNPCLCSGLQCLQTPNHSAFYSMWWEGEKPEELPRPSSSVEINTGYSILMLATCSFLWMLVFPMDTPDNKKRKYIYIYITWQKGSGVYKCDLGLEEKEGWNEWKILSSSSLWLGAGPFFSLLKTHIGSNPDISTFTLPSILHRISDRPCISLCSRISINLHKRVSIGFVNGKREGQGWCQSSSWCGKPGRAANSSCRECFTSWYYLRQLI